VESERIDLFTSPECPSCPAARAVVAAVLRGRPGVAFREWDLSRDPGPAVGRGIFATPSLLVNGSRILVGVPTHGELERCLAGRNAPAGDERG
jgi:hypothetical protein